MSMAAKIRCHVRNLPKLQMFASKQLLQYASRPVVDFVLWQMVHSGEIVRLARGVFVKPHQQIASITMKEIAEFKTSVFSRRLFTAAAVVVKQLKLSEPDAAVVAPHTYAIDGRTSSFQVFGFHNAVFHLNGTCPRKMQESRVGLAMRALWHLGKENCTAKNVRLATAQFNQQDREELHTIAPIWMPGWLHNFMFELRHKGYKAGNS